MQLLDAWIKFLRKLENDYIFASEEKMGEVITFVCEAKCVEQVTASRQLTLYLCSTQHQRRALCFDNGPIYGATIVGNCLVMHSSEWVNDKVVSGHYSVCPTSVLDGDKVVVPVEPAFHLDTFLDFIRLYLFLCKIADDSAGNINKVFQKWGSEKDKLEFQNNLRARSSEVPWRQKFDV